MVFPFRSPAASRRAKAERAGGARARAASAPAPVPVPASAAAPVNRRLISGERVLCRCSLELPKHDPFSNYREHREGYIVLNVRGGCLYLACPLDERAVERTFPRGKASTMKRFTLHPERGEPIVLGEVRARFLKTRKGRRLDGLVLRFVGLSEAQLDRLNALGEHFPVVEGDEEAAVPIAASRRPDDLSAGLG